MNRYKIKTTGDLSVSDGIIEVDGELLETMSLECKKESGQDRILVPDCIKFQEYLGGGDDIGIVFNNSRHVLSCCNDIWKVQGLIDNYMPEPSGFELVAIDAEHRKVGHTYFFCDANESISTRKCVQRYCKYLGDGEFIFATDDQGVCVSCVDWENWYEVRRIEDE